MKKVYKSFANNLRMVVDVGEKKVSIQFGWDIVSDGGRMGCSYATEDVALQQAIESSSDFGKLVWTDNVEQNEEQGEEHTMSIDEARKILIEEYGMRKEELKNKAQVVAAANAQRLVLKL